MLNKHCCCLLRDCGLLLPWGTGLEEIGGQLIPDVIGKDLWKTETGELLQKGPNVPHSGNWKLCAYNEVHKT